MFTLDEIVDQMLQTDGNLKLTHKQFTKMTENPAFGRAVGLAILLASKGAPREVASEMSGIDGDLLSILGLYPPKTKDFLIPVSYQVKGVVRVKADTLYDAIMDVYTKLNEGEINIADTMTVKDSEDIVDSTSTIRQLNEIMTTNSKLEMDYPYESETDIEVDMNDISGDIPDDMLENVFGHLFNVDKPEDEPDDDSDDNDGSEPKE